MEACDRLMNLADWRNETSDLLGLANTRVSVCLLEYEECLLLLTFVGNKTFAIEPILNAWERTDWRTKVREYPWAHPAELRDTVEH